MRNEHIFGGKKFRRPVDFEREFRPTKWSIRKYKDFTNSLNLEERFQFNRRLKKVLLAEYNDQDTINFISKVKSLEYSPEFQNKSHVSIEYKSVTSFIETIGKMKKEGIIVGSADSLARILQNEFGINRSISAIKNIIYKVGEF